MPPPYVNQGPPQQQGYAPPPQQGYAPPPQQGYKCMVKYVSKLKTTALV
jgi:hypothetical protein